MNIQANKISPGLYQHYKGGQYEVIGIVNHSESLEQLVLYKALYDSEDYPAGSLWVRPVDMFTEDVMVDGEKVKRFRFLG